MTTCKYCKKPKPDNGFKMCENCRKKCYDSNKARRERLLKGEKNRKYVKKTPKHKSPASTLDKTLEKLRAYNEKHGTRLTYGKYTALVRAGKIMG